MIKELFNNPMFVWFSGILAAVIIFKIKEMLRPVPVDENVMRLKDVKTLLAEEKEDEQEKFDLIVENAKIKVGVEVENGVRLLASENAALVTQLVADHQTHCLLHFQTMEAAVTEHSKRLKDGDKTFKALGEKVEQLRLVMVQFLPPNAIQAIIKTEASNG